MSKRDEDRDLGIITQAEARWKRSAECDFEWRIRSLADYKFSQGDSDNGWQWEESLRKLRAGENRPCLTMNIVRQHNLQISNDLRKNKSSVSFVGLGNGATQDSANVWKDVFRHVELTSDAQSAYTLARHYQINSGLGYLRLVTDYLDDETMEQDFKILPVIDPWSVYRDPDCQHLNTNMDANFSFVFDPVPNEDFEDAYPKFKELLGTEPLGQGSFIQEGALKDTTLACEYFRRVRKADRLISFVHKGERISRKASLMHPDMVKGLDESEGTRSRDIDGLGVEWFLIAGKRIIDRTTWLGSMIPLVPVPGEITKIEGRFDYKGHTRALKDAQRMYNYNASAQVEFVALQGKTPWIAAAEAIEDMEDIWNTANLTNHSVLPFNAFDEQGQPLPVPTRTQPPTAAPAYENGMESAFKQMMMTSGQYENQMGMMGNERTGAAIGKRQQQADNATFHYQDNYEASLQFLGRLFLEAAPKLYDTRRVIRIMSEDSIDNEITLDPAARQVYFADLQANQELVRRTLNPTLGKYAVAPTVGPAYGSKREETREALTLVLTQAPALTGIIGDLLMASLDFDKASEAAKRLKRMVPPQALGQGPSESEQMLQVQLAQTQEALRKALEHVAQTKIKLVGKDQMRNIDVYKAETDRMKALQEMLPQDPEGLQQLIHDLVRDAMETNLGPIIQANADEIDLHKTSPAGGDEAPPMPGTQKAEDGQWYLQDPSRETKYMKLSPLATQRAPGGRT